MAQFIGPSSSNLESPYYFSTKRTAVSTIRKESLATDEEFCSCIMQCIPEIKVFTDQVGSDTLKNDWRSFFIKTVNKVAQNPGSVGSIITAKIVNVLTGTETTLTDPNYGTLLQGQLYWWFKLDWYLVWSNLGYGSYKITIIEEGILGGGTINQFESPVYQLLPYSDKAANGTVVIESWQQGKLKHGFDYSNLTTSSISEPFPFMQRTRLPGALIAIPGDSENDHLVLDTENRSSYQIKDQVKPKYRLDLHLLDGTQVNPVMFDDLFGSPLLVTDYNVFNHVSDPRNYYANKYIQVPLLRGGYNIANPSSKVKRKTYQFDMQYDYDNVFKTGG